MEQAYKGILFLVLLTYVLGTSAFILFLSNSLPVFLTLNSTASQTNTTTQSSPYDTVLSVAILLVVLFVLYKYWKILFTFIDIYFTWFLGLLVLALPLYRTYPLIDALIFAIPLIAAAIYWFYWRKAFNLFTILNSVFWIVFLAGLFVTSTIMQKAPYAYVPFGFYLFLIVLSFLDYLFVRKTKITISAVGFMTGLKYPLPSFITSANGDEIRTLTDEGNKKGGVGMGDLVFPGCFIASLYPLGIVLWLAALIGAMACFLAIPYIAKKFKMRFIPTIPFLTLFMTVFVVIAFFL